MKSIPAYNLYLHEKESHSLCRPDIYAELEIMQIKMTELENRLAKLEDEKNNLNGHHLVREIITIKEILQLYGISRQSFWHYRKLVKLKPAAAGGKTYRCSDLEIFFAQISDLRKKNPDLFLSDSLKKRRNNNQSTKLLSRIRATVRPIKGNY